MFGRMAGPLNMAKNAIIAGVLEVLGGAPATPATGQMYFDSALSAPRWYDGAAWTNKATDALLLNGQNAAFYLGRANHTGTQLAATISNLAATVQGYTLNQFAAPTASVDAGGQKIINQADPTNPQDSATKNYVDITVELRAAGIDSKPSVRVVLTANDTLNGLAARDGVAVVAGDRVLATAQTTAAQNGVYIAAAGAWARAGDADTAGELTPGATWYIEEGSAPNAKTTWRLENTGAVVLGTTALSINKAFGALSYTASLGVQLVGSDFRAAVVAGGGISAVAGGLQVDRTVVPNRFAGNFGNGALTAIPVVHNLNTTDVVVSVKDIATGEMEGAKVVVTDANTVTITFGAAPAANAIRVVVIG
jgi:hypothetical protein